MAVMRENIRAIPCSAFDKLPFRVLSDLPSDVKVAIAIEGERPQTHFKVPGPEYLLDQGDPGISLCSRL